jgi:GNAT superfamily N-acetyltransferase
MIRDATPADTHAIAELIRGLAEYERLSHEVVLDEAALHAHLFGERRYAEVVLAEAAGAVVGFALFFHNYSTLLRKPGIYLEDLFVLPAHRGAGYGKALLARLAQIAVERGCGRLEWSVLDWNEPSIAFYRDLGAVGLDDRTIYRLVGDALTALSLAQRSPSAIREATSSDAQAIGELLRGLAEHLDGPASEFEPDEATLREHVVGGGHYAEAVVAVDGGAVVGMALFFHNYSTFLGKPGIYLEDLFVLPEHRGAGHGRALLARLAQIAVERGCGRVEWRVVDWNEPSMAFYRALGAAAMDEWTVYRLAGDALRALARR